MTETLNTGNVQLPDHGDFQAVYGRTEIIQHEAALLQEMQNNLPNSESMKRLHEAADFFRQDMRAFSADAELNEKVDAYFSGSEAMPPLFKEAKTLAEQSANRKLSWTEWMSEAASDEQLHNFLEWHNYTHQHREEDPQFQAEIAERKAGFISKIGELRSLGLLHDDTADIEARVAGTKIVLSDIFNAYIFNREGFSHSGESKVEVVEGGDVSILWHELEHNTVERPDDETNDEWAREVMAEHTAQVMISGKPEEFDPAKRGENGSRYEMDRKLMAKIMEDIPPYLVTRYYSARTPEGMEKTRKDLEDALEQKYGVRDVIDRAGSYISSHSEIDNSTSVFSPTMDFDLEKRDKAIKKLIQDPFTELGVQKPESALEIYSRRIKEDEATGRSAEEYGHDARAAMGVSARADRIRQFSGR